MEFGEKTIGKIKELIGKGLSRTLLSKEVCRIVEWKNAAGSLKEKSCRLARHFTTRGRLSSGGPGGRLHSKDAGSGDGRSRFRERSGLRAPALTRIDRTSSGRERRQGPLPDLVRPDGPSSLPGAWNAVRRLGPVSGPQFDERPIGAASFSSAVWKMAVPDKWIG